MSVTGISRISVPEGRKVRWQEIEFVKNVPKEESFCEVQVVKYEEQIWVLKIIHKKKIG
jgi:hypothetical protein